MSRIKVLLMVGLFLLILGGCQNKTAEEVKTKKVSNEEASDLFGLDKMYDGGNGDRSTEESMDDYTSTQVAAETYNHFDADPEWVNMLGNEYAVQVDDVLYVPGITATELFEKIESSSVNYTYEFNDKQLVPKYETVDISIFRDNKCWFTVTLENSWQQGKESEAKELSESLLIRITPSEEALPFSRFIDGRSYDDILQMSYRDVQQLASEKFFMKAEEESDRAEISLEIGVLLKAKVDIAHTYVDSARAYKFIINKDSGMVTSLSQITTGGSRGVYYTPPAAQIINSFSEMSEEEISEFESQAHKKLNYYGYKNIINSEMYLIKKDSEYASLIVIIENEKGGFGTSKFAECTFQKIGRNHEGKMSYSSSRVTYPINSYKSFEEYVKNTLGDCILDEKVIQEE